VAVKDGDNLQSIPSNSVRYDVWSIGYDQFACSEHPSGSPHFRVGLENVNRLENPLGYKGGILLGVFGDEISEHY
jgi:hypothetical protein